MPHGSGERSAKLAVKCLRTLLPHRDRPSSGSIKLAKRSDHMSDRCLDRVDDRAGTAVRVGAIDQEHVGKPGHAQAEVRTRHLSPLFAQPPPLGSDYLHRRNESVGVKPGRKD